MEIFKQKKKKKKSEEIDQQKQKQKDRLTKEESEVLLRNMEMHKGAFNKESVEKLLLKKVVM